MIIERRKEQARQVAKDKRIRLRKYKVTELYNAYLESLGWEKLAAPLVDEIYEVAEIKALIEHDENRTTIEEDWKAAIQSLKEGYLKQYRNKLKNDCLTRLVEARTVLQSEEMGLDGNEALLYYADAFFHCAPCTQIDKTCKEMSKVNMQAYPSILTHAPHGFGECKGQFVACDPSALSLARRLLTLLDLPMTITMVGMEQKGNVFVCLCCEPVLQIKRNWEQLVCFYYTKFLSGSYRKQI